MQAEAAYEALKGLLEENILQRISLNKQQAADEDDSPDFSSSSRPASRLVARKSTGPDSRARPGDVCRNVAAKSTGPHAKFWPETRLEIPYSFYGIPPEPIDPKLIKTRMALGELLMLSLRAQMFNAQFKFRWDRVHSGRGEDGGTYQLGAQARAR